MAVKELLTLMKVYIRISMIEKTTIRCLKIHSECLIRLLRKEKSRLMILNKKRLVYKGDWDIKVCFEI